MKTPLTYYGGKQSLSKKIVKLMPEHRIYVEPFLGGGAVFWAKAPSPLEVLNDTNGEIVNFYEVLRNDFDALNNEIQSSLHSREQHRGAQVIYENSFMFDKIKCAWAVWMLANCSYGSILDGSFGYNLSGAYECKLDAKRKNFVMDMSGRLQKTQIERSDALRVIRSRDTLETFLYIDPPYVGADQGHYDGYAQKDFDALLGTLDNLKGKFMLSSYRNKSLAEHGKKNGWHTVELRRANAMTSKKPGVRRKEKTKCLTANYHIWLERAVGRIFQTGAIGALGSPFLPGLYFRRKSVRCRERLDLRVQSGGGFSITRIR